MLFVSTTQVTEVKNVDFTRTKYIIVRTVLAATENSYSFVQVHTYTRIKNHATVTVHCTSHQTTAVISNDHKPT